MVTRPVTTMLTWASSAIRKWYPAGASVKQSSISRELLIWKPGNECPWLGTSADTLQSIETWMADSAWVRLILKDCLTPKGQPEPAVGTSLR